MSHQPDALEEFGPYLHRSVGAARAHLREIERGLSPEALAPLERNVARLHQELDYLSRLADDMALWAYIPQPPFASVRVAEALAPVVALLRRVHPGVTVTLDVDAGHTACGTGHAVQAIARAIVENAFHAAILNSSEVATVRVESNARSSTVVLSVFDSGRGIHGSDRENVFIPGRSTKKGGGGSPLGTGMGLPIARRLARHLGGEVAIDETSEQTCVYVELPQPREGIAP